MQISEEYVEKYQRVSLQEYGEEINQEQAYTELLALVNLIETVEDYYNQLSDEERAKISREDISS